MFSSLSSLDTILAKRNNNASSKYTYYNLIQDSATITYPWSSVPPTATSLAMNSNENIAVICCSGTFPPIQFSTYSNGSWSPFQATYATTVSNYRKIALNKNATIGVCLDATNVYVFTILYFEFYYSYSEVATVSHSYGLLNDCTLSYDGSRLFLAPTTTYVSYGTWNGSTFASFKNISDTTNSSGSKSVFIVQDASSLFFCKGNNTYVSTWNSGTSNYATGVKTLDSSNNITAFFVPPNKQTIFGITSNQNLVSAYWNGTNYSIYYTYNYNAYGYVPMNIYFSSFTNSIYSTVSQVVTTTPIYNIIQLNLNYTVPINEPPPASSLLTNMNGIGINGLETFALFYSRSAASNPITFSQKTSSGIWTAVAPALETTQRNYTDVAVSYNGTISVFSTTSYIYFCSWSPNKISVSKLTQILDTNSRNYQSVAITNDGSKIFACVSGGLIYYSTWNGVNFLSFTQTLETNSRSYLSITCSQDGNHIAYCAQGVGLFWSYWQGSNYVVGIPISISSTVWTSLIASSYISLQMHSDAKVLYFMSSNTGNNVYYLNTYSNILNTIPCSGLNTNPVLNGNFAVLPSGRQWYLMNTNTCQVYRIPIQTTNTLYNLYSFIDNYSTVGSNISNISDIALNKDESQIVLVSATTGYMYYSAITNGTISTLTQTSESSTHSYKSVSLSIDGSFGVALNESNLISYFSWNGTNYSALSSLDSTSRSYTSCAVSGNKAVIVACVSGGLIYYSVKQGNGIYTTPTTTLETRTSTWAAIAISTDSARIAYYYSDASNPLAFWANWNGTNYNAGYPISTNGVSLNKLMFSSDNSILYGCGSSNVYYSLWTGSNYSPFIPFTFLTLYGGPPYETSVNTFGTSSYSTIPLPSNPPLNNIANFTFNYANRIVMTSDGTRLLISFIDIGRGGSNTYLSTYNGSSWSNLSRIYAGTSCVCISSDGSRGAWLVAGTSPYIQYFTWDSGQQTYPLSTNLTTINSTFSNVLSSNISALNGLNMSGDGTTIVLGSKNTNYYFSKWSGSNYGQITQILKTVTRVWDINITYDASIIVYFEFGSGAGTQFIYLSAWNGTNYALPYASISVTGLWTQSPGQLWVSPTANVIFFGTYNTNGSTNLYYCNKTSSTTYSSPTSIYSYIPSSNTTFQNVYSQGAFFLTSNSIIIGVNPYKLFVLPIVYNTVGGLEYFTNVNWINPYTNNLYGFLNLQQILKYPLPTGMISITNTTLTRNQYNVNLFISYANDVSLNYATYNISVGNTSYISYNPCSLAINNLLPQTIYPISYTATLLNGNTQSYKNVVYTPINTTGGGVVQISTVSKYIYYMYFTASGTFAIQSPVTNAQFFLVGGGGGGGFAAAGDLSNAGAGGAGGVVYGTMNLSPGTYTVSIGNGGIGCGSSINPSINSGGNTTLTSTGVLITALGGGYGGSLKSNGGNGGSGGGGYTSYTGGSALQLTQSQTGVLTYTNLGNVGGANGGGGGGAGGTSNGTTGGSGFYWPIYNTIAFAAGGNSGVSGNIANSIGGSNFPVANGIFSCKLVNINYTGPMLNIRRSTDNAVQDFYCNNTGTLIGTSYGGGGTSYSSWIGSATGYVTTWYDQSSKGNHATQTNTTYQPIFNSTSLYVDFTVSNSYFNLPNATVPYNMSYTVTVYHNQITSNSNNCVIYSGENGTGNNRSNFFYILNTATNAYINDWWGNAFTGGTYTSGNTVTWEYDSTTTNTTLYINGNYVTSGIRTSFNSTGSNNTIGFITNSAFHAYFKGQLYSIFLYPSALSSANRATIESTTPIATTFGTDASANTGNGGTASVSSSQDISGNNGGSGYFAMLLKSYAEIYTSTITSIDSQTLQIQNLSGSYSNYTVNITYPSTLTYTGITTSVFRIYGLTRDTSYNINMVPYDSYGNTGITYTLPQICTLPKLTGNIQAIDTSSIQIYNISGSFQYYVYQDLSYILKGVYTNNQTTSVSYTGFSPNTSHRFYLLPYNYSGISGDITSLTIYTKPNITSVSSYSFTAIDTSSVQLQVYGISGNYSSFAFYGNSTQVGSFTGTTNATPAILGRLITDTSYNISIIPYNPDGVSGAVFSIGAVCTRPNITSVSVVAVSTTSLTITCSGSYASFYLYDRLQSSRITTNISYTTNSCTVTGLSPDTSYAYSVLPYNYSNVSGAFFPVPYTYTWGSIFVSTGTFSSIDSSSAIVQWYDVTGYLSKYTLVVNSVTYGPYTTSYGTQYVSGLTANTNYTAYLYAINHGNITSGTSTSAGTFYTLAKLTTAYISLVTPGSVKVNLGGPYTKCSIYDSNQNYYNQSSGSSVSAYNLSFNTTYYFYLIPYNVNGDPSPPYSLFSTPVTTYQAKFFNPLISLQGWTSSGGVTAGATFFLPSSLSGSNSNNTVYAYTNCGINLIGKIITISSQTNTGFSMFYFGCDASGSGQMLQLGNGSWTSNFSTTTNWTTSTPVTGSTNTVPSGYTSYNVRIIISTSGYASWYLNGALMQQNYPFSNKGTYVGVNGGGGAYGVDYFNLAIYDIPQIYSINYPSVQAIDSSSIQVQFFYANFPYSSYFLLYSNGTALPTSYPSSLSTQTILLGNFSPDSSYNISMTLFNNAGLSGDSYNFGTVRTYPSLTSTINTLTSNSIQFNISGVYSYYYVYDTSLSSNAYLQQSTPQTATTYTISGLSTGYLYNFWITPYNINGVSGTPTYFNQTLIANTVLYSNNCTSFTGWTTSGSPSLGFSTFNYFNFPNGGVYAYTNVGFSMLGMNITFKVYIYGGCPDFFFCCNSTGAGQMVRFDSRGSSGSGITSTSSWTSWNGPSASYTITQNTWMDVKIAITSNGTASVYFNNTLVQANYTLRNGGVDTYIGCQSDNGGGGMYVSNIAITSNSVVPNIIPQIYSIGYTPVLTALTTDAVQVSLSAIAIPSNTKYYLYSQSTPYNEIQTFGPYTSLNLSVIIYSLRTDTSYNITLVPYNITTGVSGSIFTVGTVCTLPLITSGYVTNITTTTVQMNISGAYNTYLITESNSLSFTQPSNSAPTTTLTSMIPNSTYNFNIIPYNYSNVYGNAYYVAYFTTLPQITSVVFQPPVNNTITLQINGLFSSFDISNNNDGTGTDYALGVYGNTYTTIALTLNAGYSFTIIPYNSQGAAGASFITSTVVNTPPYSPYLLGTETVYYPFDNDLYNWGSGAAISDLSIPTAPTGSITLNSSNFANNTDTYGRVGSNGSVYFYNPSGNIITATCKYLKNVGSITINKTTGFSVSFWMNISSPNYGSIFTLGDISTACFQCKWNNDNPPTMTFYSQNSSKVGTTANYTFAFNNWAHVVGVFSYADNSFNLYVNNVKKLSSTLAYPVAIYPAVDTPLPLYIGSNGNNSGGFTGYIDDLRFYNGVLLSPTQIASLYSYCPTIDTNATNVYSSDPNTIVMNISGSYTVYSILPNFINSNSSQTILRSLQPDTSYSYQIVPYNALNLSGGSYNITVCTLPLLYTANILAETSTSVQLNVSGVYATYNILNNGTTMVSNVSASTYVLSGLSTATIYNLSIVPYNYSGISGSSVLSLPNVMTLLPFYSNNGSSFTNWTVSASGCSLVSGGITPAPANYYSIDVNAYTYYNLGVNLFGCTIEFLVNVSNGCNPEFLFACSSTGVGNMCRLDARVSQNSGFGDSYSWTSFQMRSNNVLLPSYGSWKKVLLSISSDGYASFTYDGILLQSNYSIVNGGTYIGWNGGSAGSAPFFVSNMSFYNSSPQIYSVLSPMIYAVDISTINVNLSGIYYSGIYTKAYTLSVDTQTFGPYTAGSNISNVFVSGLQPDTSYNISLTPYDVNNIAGTPTVVQTTCTLGQITSFSSSTLSAVDISSIQVQINGITGAYSYYGIYVNNRYSNVSNSTTNFPSTTITGLSADTSYNVSIIPYNYSGISGINYGKNVGTICTLPYILSSAISATSSNTFITYTVSDGSYNYFILSDGSNIPVYYTKNATYTVYGLSSNTSYQYGIVPYNYSGISGSVVTTPSMNTLLFSASGGLYNSFSISGLSNTFIFTNSGTFTIGVNMVNVYFILVGGGGGGGGCYWSWEGGGGGGAGTVIVGSGLNLSGGTYTVTIGSGGTGGIGSSLTNSTSGKNSVFSGSTFTYTASGGGFGGDGFNTATHLVGGSGGSGGGGSVAFGNNAGGSIGSLISGNGIISFANTGGSGNSGGGGGGAMSSGGTVGGTGYKWLDGNYYGAGGAGGGNTLSSPKLGGSGIGGNSGYTSNYNGTNASANTGSGGGSASGTNSINVIASGGNGSNGIFLIGFNTAFVNVNLPSPPSSITGGTYNTFSVSGFNNSLKFTSSGSFSLSNDISNVYFILIGGGGGGGGCNGGNEGGGGGGAGMVIIGAAITLTSGTYTITIGNGGNGGIGSSLTYSQSGGSSILSCSLFTYTATGGGFGGDGTGYNKPGGNGGSGGGGAGWDSSIGGNAGTSVSGTGITSYATKGGNGFNYLNSSGGGGGATAQGNNGISTQGGNGGSGYQWIDGNYYAGGGGGGSKNSQSSGGSGIGGNSGYSSNYGGYNGATNTGSGGGGAFGNATVGTGGSGAKGIFLMVW